MAQAKVRVSRGPAPPLAIRGGAVKAAAEADAAKAVAAADNAAKVAAGSAETGPGGLSSLKTEEATALELCISALQARLNALQGA